MVLAFARGVRDPLILGHEHPDERSVLTDALEVFARERALPFATRNAIGTGDVDDGVPTAIFIPITHRNFVIAPRRGIDDDRLGQWQQLQSQFRSGWRGLG